MFCLILILIMNLLLCNKINIEGITNLEQIPSYSSLNVFCYKNGQPCNSYVLSSGKLKISFVCDNNGREKKRTVEQFNEKNLVCCVEIFEFGELISLTTTTYNGTFVTSVVSYVRKESGLYEKTTKENVSAANLPKSLLLVAQTKQQEEVKLNVPIEIFDKEGRLVGIDVYDKLGERLYKKRCLVINYGRECRFEIDSRERGVDELSKSNFQENVANVVSSFLDKDIKFFENNWEKLFFGNDFRMNFYSTVKDSKDFYSIFRIFDNRQKNGRQILEINFFAKTMIFFHENECKTKVSYEGRFDSYSLRGVQHSVYSLTINKIIYDKKGSFASKTGVKKIYNTDSENWSLIQESPLDS